MAGPDALKDRLQAQLRQVARARVQELGLRQKDLAARIYNVEQVSAAQLNMVARILSGGSTMLAQNGVRLLQALGLRELGLVWQEWPTRVGDARPPVMLPPGTPLDQQLAWAANQRRLDLGWTQNDVALRVMGPRSGEPISDKRVAAFLNGHIHLFSEVGLEILQALGLDRFELSWQPLEQVAAQPSPRAQNKEVVRSDAPGLPPRTPRLRVNAEFSRQELQQLEVEAKDQGITLEELIRNAVLLSSKLNL